MKTRHFTIGIALVLLLAGAGNSDEVKTKHVRCTGSGTFADGVETRIDTNGDDLSAGLSQGLDNCNIGRFFWQEVDEYQAPLPAPVTCPVGTDEFHVQQGHGITTEEKTGDQLFYEYAPNTVTLCLYPDLRFSVTFKGTYTGGTGQFANASGVYEGQATGQYLVFGEKGGVFGGFGQFNGTYSGTLTLPEGE
jgi:hypothetical protein